ncbi:Predicted nucleic acid-binding protein, contains PIN domain [Methylobacterium sp. 174MFSha1.1]|uniref:PIN domain-containing protein n=1 Tax=Methylobacterium sp. 174MFSha1.1 TaxID=1502749 RepID=UPI0008E80319|nr:PIN domain-containing protein [Methylobacterium sp. 174MFSha1.1]SFU99995.1 Predicted nucleic acid-binding protein, contains PIN domain [Methylobacterium sp. 174MFSha1.1]
MIVDCFIDTNVLVYAISGAPDEAEKARQAREIVARRKFGTSGQVLQEFFVVATRKIRRGISVEQALQIIDEFDDLPCVPTDAQLVREGILASQRFNISYWDGAILAAAEKLRAPILYTEDLSHDKMYGSVRVVNPFKAH